MGNSPPGKPWRNPEDELIRSRFEPDQVPPPCRPGLDADPLYRPEPAITLEEEEMNARLRASNMDCIGDTLEFAKLPAALGLGWGAAMAAVHAKPDLGELNRHIGTRLSLGIKGFLRELRYLKSPFLFLGKYFASVGWRISCRLLTSFCIRISFLVLILCTIRLIL